MGDDQKLQGRAGRQNPGLKDEMVEWMVSAKERDYEREENKG